MSKYTILDVEKWNRKEHFYFFDSFEEPYFGLTTHVDVTKAYLKAKEEKTSFFIYYLHKSLCAVNEIKPLKYRIFNDNVLEYNEINASATINRDDGTFAFSFIKFDLDYTIFEQHAMIEIQRIRNTTNLMPSTNGLDAIHYSSLPWLRFTSLSHARKYSHKDSVPKISFGKLLTQNGTMDMPCSIHVHHGLVDGKDVGEYFSLFQELLNQ